MTETKNPMELLKSKIGAHKYNQLNNKGYFEEKSKYGWVRFYKDRAGGVTLVESRTYGTTVRELEWDLCVQSQAPDLPAGDVILSRWMEWKQDEDKFLDTANFRAVHTRDEAKDRRPIERIDGVEHEAVWVDEQAEIPPEVFLPCPQLSNRPIAWRRYPPVGS